MATDYQGADWYASETRQKQPCQRFVPVQQTRAACTNSAHTVLECAECVGQQACLGGMRRPNSGADRRAGTYRTVHVLLQTCNYYTCGEVQPSTARSTKAWRSVARRTGGAPGRHHRGHQPATPRHTTPRSDRGTDIAWLPGPATRRDHAGVAFHRTPKSSVAVRGTAGQLTSVAPAPLACPPGTAGPGGSLVSRMSHQHRSKETKKQHQSKAPLSPPSCMNSPPRGLEFIP